jgi:hypothetical protein
LPIFATFLPFFAYFLPIFCLFFAYFLRNKKNHNIGPLFPAPGEDELQFLPGIVVKHGRFVCGQFIGDASGDIRFVRGQVVSTSQGPKFVVGQTVNTPDGIKFVAG